MKLLTRTAVVVAAAAAVLVPALPAHAAPSSVPGPGWSASWRANDWSGDELYDNGVSYDMAIPGIKLHGSVHVAPPGLTFAFQLTDNTPEREISAWVEFVGNDDYYVGIANQGTIQGSFDDRTPGAYTIRFYLMNFNGVPFAESKLDLPDFNAHQGLEQPGTNAGWTYTSDPKYYGHVLFSVARPAFYFGGEAAPTLTGDREILAATNPFPAPSCTLTEISDSTQTVAPLDSIKACNTQAIINSHVTTSDKVFRVTNCLLDQVTGKTSECFHLGVY